MLGDSSLGRSGPYVRNSVELPAKLLDYFLRINKSNINQLESRSRSKALMNKSNRRGDKTEPWTVPVSS